MGEGARTVPVRTCVACGRRAPQAELLRLAVAEGRVEPDPRRRLPGRGAYICRRLVCAQNAARGRRRGRGFKQALGEGAWAGLLQRPEICSLPS